MIRVFSTDNAPVTFNVTASGLVIYLDSWALFDLAEGDSSRRKRFIDALHSGAELLFSVSNVAELAGPQGQSVEAIRTFLDEIGPHWCPVELNPTVVVEREQKGKSQAETCFSPQFMKDFAAHTMNLPSNAKKVICLSDDFFRLGPVLEWVGPQRDSLRSGSTDLDNALINRLNEHRTNFNEDSAWLDQKFPVLQFRPDMPGTFAYIGLVRALIIEGHKPKPNDGLDFCHAVLASAFASVAALDKHWKRRVESLPKPNQLAHVYYQPELNEMVGAIELWLKDNKAVSATSS